MYVKAAGKLAIRKDSALWLALLVFFSQPVLAQGLDKVNDFLENIESLMHGVAIVVVTIAVMWAGYKYLFKHAGLEEVGRILAGGLLIGGSAEIAAWLLA
mgnify:CR=1 FL=1